MQNNVVDIILFVARLLRSGRTLSEINKEQLLKLYSISEISAAYSWVLQKMNDNSALYFSNHAPHNLRVLHQAERMMITKEAQGYLMDMYINGVINYEQLEQIIEISMMGSFEKTDLEKVKKLIFQLLLGDNSIRKSASVIYLNGNESVN